MTVVQINATCTVGSTGQICSAISRLLDRCGIENYILHTQPRGKHPRGIRYAGFLYVKGQALRSRVRGCYGFNSRNATRRLLRKLDAIRPTLVHLHNLHGHNVHLGMLLMYLREKGIRTIWTFHDCWAFTAYCPHYDGIGCAQWKVGCRQCPLQHRFSWFFDCSRWLFDQKKEAIRGLDLTVVTPSVWLESQVKQSFFREYPVRVIRNGVDIDVFKPTASGFRKRYGLEDKRILLGVAYMWNRRKGIDVFEALAERLEDTHRIVLVGVDPQTEKRLSPHILCLPRVHDATVLAQIYTAADVFINPTREEVWGLVNLEALSCGTPVVTFDTGGSPECVDDTCGIVVARDDVQGLWESIRYVITENPFSLEACRARAKAFDAEIAFGEYLELYGSYDESITTKTI
ncbi:MAG: glycosyltransferase [Clostridia bacterium]|nr:glycosyltransferase [Clostridia bacterium]